jgi:hypothetical protein
MGAPHTIELRDRDIVLLSTNVTLIGGESRAFRGFCINIALLKILFDM